MKFFNFTSYVFTFKKHAVIRKVIAKLVLENALCQFLNSFRRQYCRWFLNWM